jgi:hypothetical protein
MKISTRKDYLELVETRYFASVMREDFPALLDCFSSDGHITIYHGDNPVQDFYRAPQPGKNDFSVFYGHLWTNYHVHFAQFRHVIDAEQNCASSIFLPTLTPKTASNSNDAKKLHLNNCNFFWFENGLIAEMIIYYANPTLGAKMGISTQTPTAFPKG